VIRPGDVCESGIPGHATHLAHGVRDGRALCELCAYDWEMAALRAFNAAGVA